MYEIVSWPLFITAALCFTTQFNSILLFTLYQIFILYIVRQGYINKVEEEGKKRKINGGLGRSVRWSEELSFQANHCNGCAPPAPSWPVMLNYFSGATRKFFHRNHMLGTQDFMGPEHWAPFNFFQSTALLLQKTLVCLLISDRLMLFL